VEKCFEFEQAEPVPVFQLDARNEAVVDDLAAVVKVAVPTMEVAVPFWTALRRPIGDCDLWVVSISDRQMALIVVPNAAAVYNARDAQLAGDATLAAFAQLAGVWQFAGDAQLAGDA